MPENDKNYDADIFYNERSLHKLEKKITQLEHELEVNNIMEN